MSNWQDITFIGSAFCVEMDTEQVGVYRHCTRDPREGWPLGDWRDGHPDDVGKTDHEQNAMDRRAFMELVANEFIANNIADHVAESYADQAMRDFEEMEGTTVGDPDYVWGQEGAEIMASEFIENHLGES